MNKEQIEQILVEYGVPFTDVLADRLLKEFTDSVAWLDGQETGFRDGYYKAHEKGKADTIEVLQEIRQEILETKHIMTEGKTVKINNHSTVHDIVNGLNMAIGIVERHIKEIEGCNIS